MAETTGLNPACNTVAPDAYIASLIVGSKVPKERLAAMKTESGKVIINVAPETLRIE